MKAENLWGCIPSVAEIAGAILLLVTLGGGYFFIRALTGQEPWALILAGFIGFAFALLFATGILMLILFSTTWIDERRARQEQIRFIDNAKENLTIMATMQKVQNAQNAMLLRQAKETKLLGSSDDADPDTFGAYDDALFEELEQ